MSFFVIPAEAGIQYFQLLINDLDSGACPGPDPGFTGVTIFYETINDDLVKSHQNDGNPDVSEFFRFRRRAFQFYSGPSFSIFIPQP